MKVFLGGTCNKSTWRNQIIPNLEIDYFDPVVDAWSDEAYQKEIVEKENSDYFLYVLTPAYTGLYSFAEVVDESYHFSNRTIFCYLKEADGKLFSDAEIESLDKLGDRVVENGGRWLDTLDEITAFLNSASNKVEKPPKYDFFISYARADSKGFVSKLYMSLDKLGKETWFDKYNIPIGTDFQQEINDGIRKSDNFIYVISPNSVKSKYCDKELHLAIKYGKRIIPLLHITENGLEGIMHPIVSTVNWIYFDTDKKYQLSVKDLVKLQEDEEKDTSTHTDLLKKAYDWEKDADNDLRLLPYGDYLKAMEWLNEPRTNYNCTPSESHKNYILSNKRFYSKEISDLGVFYAKDQLNNISPIIEKFKGNGFTTSPIEIDTESQDFGQKELVKIGECSTIMIVVSRNIVHHSSFKSCIDAVNGLNKRIFYIYIEAVDPQAKGLVPIGFDVFDFSSLNKEANEDFDEDSEFDEIIENVVQFLENDYSYFNDHNYYHNKFEQWELHGEDDSLLLYDNVLEGATNWLEYKINNDAFAPTKEHRKYIELSAKTKTIDLKDIIIIGHEEETILIKKLGRELRIQGKNVAFDMLPDFNKYLLEAEKNAHNVLLVGNKTTAFAELAPKVLALNKKTILAYQEDKEPELKHTPSLVIANDIRRSIRSIIQLIDTDKDHVENHTKWLLKAIDWQKSKKDVGLLLGSSETLFAEKWIEEAEAGKKSPSVTSLQKTFIVASKEDKKKKARTKRIITNSMIALSIVMTISLVGVWFSLSELQEAHNTLDKKSKELEKSKETLLDKNETLVEQEQEITKSAKDLYSKNAKLTVTQDSLQESGVELARLLKKEEKLKDLAQDKELEAVEAKGVAEKAEGKAIRSLMLSEAKMLNKHANRIKKSRKKNSASLLVYAYKLNEEYNGPQMDNEAYNGFEEMAPMLSGKIETKRAINDVILTSNYIITSDLNGSILISNNAGKKLSILEVGQRSTDMLWQEHNSILYIANGTAIIYKVILDKNKSELSEINYPVNVSFVREMSRKFVVVTKNAIMIGDDINKPSSFSDIKVTGGEISQFDCVKNEMVWTEGRNLYFSEYSQNKLKSVEKVTFTNQISSISIGNSSALFAGDVRGHIFIVNKISKQASLLGEHDYKVTDLLFQDGSLFSTSLDKTFRIWSLDGFEKSKINETIVFETNSWLRCVSIRKNWLAVGGDSKVVRFLPASSSVVYNQIKDKHKDLNRDMLKEYSDVDHQKVINKLYK